MRWLQWVLAACAIPAVWLAYERIAGPRCGPLPGSLPHIVRRPGPAALRPAAAGEGVAHTPDVQRLHALGIKGRNVGIAVIDSFLLVDHREFSGRVRWYDEIDAWPDDPAGWHGTAVASVAAGNTTGVAPEADLYFVGLGLLWSREPAGNWFHALRRAAHNGQSQAVAIRRVLALNARLAPDRRIRVLSLSIGDVPADAIAQARREGMFVASAELGTIRRGPVRVASAAGIDRYLTAPAAGSWNIAYEAGRYALACQQDPAMTPLRYTPQNTHETRRRMRPRRVVARRAGQQPPLQHPPAHPWRPERRILLVTR